MTTIRVADLPRWVRQQQQIMDAVVSQATGDLLNSIEIVPGIARGGSRVRGTIPRDLGALARSKQSTLYGSTSLTSEGEDSHVLIAGAMKAGDVATFSWGGAAAPYAHAVHYGANGVPGTFWIDVAADGWQRTVAGAVRRARAALG